MAGAAVLAARAALRSGAGLVTALLPESLSTILAVGVPEATQRLLPEAVTGDTDALVRALDAIDASIFDSLAVGPGLGTDARARALVDWALKQAVPQVVDADALNVIVLPHDETRRKVEPFDGRVWTPHPGEFRRLTGNSPGSEEERIEAAEEFVARFGGVLVLKGHRTVIMDERRYAINESGNPGMATGGAGDVLTGMIAALLGQGYAAFDAARLGAHLHGRAGDLARDDIGEVSLIAGDLVEAIPRAVLERQRGPS
jgi:NAD(P)H-hydrate epimerase